MQINMETCTLCLYVNFCKLCILTNCLDFAFRFYDFLCIHIDFCIVNVFLYKNRNKFRVEIYILQGIEIWKHIEIYTLTVITM